MSDNQSPIEGQDRFDDDDGEPFTDNAVDEELEEAVQVILNLKDSWDSESFMEDYQDYLGYTVCAQGNILHRLASELSDHKDKVAKLPHLPQLLTTIMDNYPHLLNESQAPETESTPLSIAIQKKNVQVALLFLKSFERSQCQPSTCIHDSLGPCLQIAIRNNLHEGMIQEMVKQASDRVLASQDKAGRTPLHEAVTYQDCTEARVETIRQMLRIATQALCVMDNESHSFYMHHLETRKSYLREAEQRRQEANRKREQKRLEAETKKVSANRSKGDELDPRAGNVTPRVEKNLDPKAEEKAKNSQTSRLDETLRIESQRDHTSRWNETLRPRPGNSIEGDTYHGIRPNQGSRREPIPNPELGIVRKDSFKPGISVDVEGLKNDEDRKREHGRMSEYPRKGDDIDKLRMKERRKHKELKEKEKAEKADRTRPEILAKSSEDITLDIKLHCMRMLSPKETSQILYGKNPESRQSSINVDDFKASFSHIRFNSILQYVAFPAVKLSRSKGKEGKQQEDGGPLGRDDMVEIFKWLRDKGVTRIVKVIVEDFDEFPHTDTAIVECLKGLNVEKLWWLKTDLDPVTILDVSREIREIRLRWSGSNTALRAWGDPFGLRQLKRLDIVYLDLIPEKNLESDKVTKSRINIFKARLNTISTDNVDENSATLGDVPEIDPLNPNSDEPRRIRVEQVNTQSSNRTIAGGASWTAGSSQSQDNHKWLETMDEFGKAMVKVWKAAQKDVDHNKSSLHKPITVALIDDGVDLLDPSLLRREKIYEGKTLSYDINAEPKTDQRENAFWESAGGHGTVMANMIYRVCPMVNLYVIRVETQQGGNEGNFKNRIDPHSAAEAVQAAVDKGVNVISMSWTVSPDTSTHSSKNELRMAIENAYEANILMFASSSDGGHFSEASWPVAINRNYFFRIGAANANGTPFDWAGKVENLDYILPGVDVVKAGMTPAMLGTRYKEKLEKMETNTGSSVATALAAGLAAMMLTCVKIAVIEGSTGLQENVVSTMQNKEHMETMLKRLHMTDSKYIEVWKQLSITTLPNWRESQDKGKMKILADKIRCLIPAAVFETEK